jgi:hypothetical protein
MPLDTLAVVRISQDRIHPLRTEVAELPPNQLSEGWLSRAFVESAREMVDKSDRHELVDSVLTSLRHSGATLIRMSLPIDVLEAEMVRMASAVLSWVSWPFRMIRRLGLWQELPVDLSAESYRFGGIGHNPLHIDGVNCTWPPDLLCLLCVRGDPRGGGASLLSNIDTALAKLSEPARRHLSEDRFEEGRFYSMWGVGDEVRPFRVLDHDSSGRWVRVTGKMLPDMKDGSDKEALEELVELLEETAVQVRLQHGDMLLVDQRKTVHGRTPLGPGQEIEVARGTSRLLRQCFSRYSVPPDLYPTV